MDAKKFIVKSKSSNITNNIENRSLDRRSNGGFKKNVHKKRGVYVEKKVTKTDFGSPESISKQEKPIKAPPRPKSGQKAFLNSVLTILSKSTIGTQYPDGNHPNVKRGRTRNKIRRNAYENATNDTAVNKLKYRSKILNKDLGKEETNDDIIVLQSQKSINHTPSMNSENNSFNCSNRPSFYKKALGEYNNESFNNFSDITNLLVKEVMEGKRYNKRVRIDEPATLVAKVNATDSDKNDKGLYNFFVDLIETTISVYNVKANFDKAPNISDNPSSSKVQMEIEEAVAKKLDINKNSAKGSPHESETGFYCLRDTDELIGIDDFSLTSLADAISPKPIVKNNKYVKTKSFPLLKRRQSRKIKADSLIFDRKKVFTRKQKKKTVLNLFKEQLKMDVEEFEEPQNMYQALKVIADSKKRCQRIIHFEDREERNVKDYGYPECVFKRPKIISTSRKWKKIKKNFSSNAEDCRDASRKKLTSSECESNGLKTESYHSLEVYGFDYQPPSSRGYSATNKDGYHHSPSISDEEKEFVYNNVEYSHSFFENF